MKFIYILTVLLISMLGLGAAYGQGIEAGSWGGKVRAGPGMQYGQIGSLQNGDPVRLLENTRVMENGYPWFKISFKGGKIGYKWGGILCGFGHAIAGVFRVCEKDNRYGSPIQGQSMKKISCAAEGSVRSVKGDIPVKISFRVVGENDETQFKIYWLDYQGHRKLYKHIFAGDLYHQSTFVTHPWLVTAPVPGGGEDCIAIYFPVRNARTVVLR